MDEKQDRPTFNIPYIQLCYHKAKVVWPYWHYYRV